MTTQTVKEHPILFGGPMVRALLDGRKMQTRRVIKHQPRPFSAADDPGPFLWFLHTGYPEGRIRESQMSQAVSPFCRYGRSGDLLWVRETFFCNSLDYPEPTEHARENLYYRADGEPEMGGESISREGGGWRSSIHMPRWASRLTLEITGVRVERVQDITEADARAEGAVDYIQSLTAPRTSDRLTELACRHTKRLDPAATVASARGHFAALWDEINARRGHPWQSNPWCWAITFRKAEDA